jgi:hypothetical protein
LNHPGDIGHGIVVTFGNYPLKTYFTPSFKVPLYQFGEMDSSELEEHSFNERDAFYDINRRNNRVLTKPEGPKAENTKQNEKQKKSKEHESFNQAELLALFTEYLKTHPGITLKDFMAMLEAGEIPLQKEGAAQ